MFLNPFFTTINNLNAIKQTPTQLTDNINTNNDSQNIDSCCETKNDFAKDLNEEMLFAYLFNQNVPNTSNTFNQLNSNVSNQNINLELDNPKFVAANNTNKLPNDFKQEILNLIDKFEQNPLNKITHSLEEKDLYSENANFPVDISSKQTHFYNSQNIHKEQTIPNEVLIDFTTENKLKNPNNDFELNRNDLKNLLFPSHQSFSTDEVKSFLIPNIGNVVVIKKETQENESFVQYEEFKLLQENKNPQKIENTTLNQTDKNNLALNAKSLTQENTSSPTISLKQIQTDITKTNDYLENNSSTTKTNYTENSTKNIETNQNQPVEFKNESSGSHSENQGQNKDSEKSTDKKELLLSDIKNNPNINTNQSAQTGANTQRLDNTLQSEKFTKKIFDKVKNYIDSNPSTLLGRSRIQIKDPVIGQININISMSNNKTITLEIQTPNSKFNENFLKSSDDLKKILTEKNVTLDSVSVKTIQPEHLNQNDLQTNQGIHTAHSTDLSTRLMDFMSNNGQGFQNQNSNQFQNQQYPQNLNLQQNQNSFSLFGGNQQNLSQSNDSNYNDFKGQNDAKKYLAVKKNTIQNIERGANGSIKILV